MDAVTRYTDEQMANRAGDLCEHSKQEAGRVHDPVRTLAPTGTVYSSYSKIPESSN